MATQASNPLIEATHNLEELAFTCRICERVFTTNNGRGQHMRSHIEDYNNDINVNRVKKQWSNEEVEIMAQEEAQAIIDGVKFMNQHLATLMTHRTVDAIKGRRKQDAYKQVVDRYLDELNRSNDTGAIVLNVDVENQVDSIAEDSPMQDYDVSINEAITECMNGIDLERPQYRNALHLVHAAELVLNGDSLENNCLSNWIKSIFKCESKVPKGPKYERCKLVGRAKAIRRQEYALVQKLYKRSIGTAASRILDGNEDLTMPPAVEVIDFWKTVFGKQDSSETMIDDVEQNNETGFSNGELSGLWVPITVDEVKNSELAHGSAPGPDGIKVGSWNKIDLKVRTLFYNIIMKRGSLERDLKKARTILLPKGKGMLSPSETRPISIMSVIVRQLHKIMANRFKKLNVFDDSQRAFIDCDGTMENLSIISTILHDARLERKEVHIATIDLKKAFDSVEHSTIISTIRALGCPRPFVKYIEELYNDAQTILQYKNTNTLLNIEQGVLQGDPLSPLLFNAVIDRAIKVLPSNVGYRLNGKNFNCVAYADDIIIVGSTKLGLQLALDAFTAKLATFGLVINCAKSSTVSLVPSGKEKKIKTLVEPQFKINNEHLKAIGPIDLWKYLGVQFVGSKKLYQDISLVEMLKKIEKAPLKPQQRIKILKTVVIPKYMHTLVLGKTTKGKLDAYDQSVRTFVKRWLRLPLDLPVAYLYASVNDGGLGIPKISEQVPMIRKSRLENFINKDNDVSKIFKESSYIQRQLQWCNSILAHMAPTMSKMIKNDLHRVKLLDMVDTKDLAEAKYCKASNSWVEDRALDISGSDYIKYHHIRAGCLPSRARTSRGRCLERSCRAGCKVSETNYHIIQICHRTHGGRVFRHDRVVKMLAKHFEKRERTQVLIEPVIKTSIGNRKPDLVITKEGTSYVLDVQVVSGNNLERDYVAKKNKYRSIDNFDNLIKRRCASRTVIYDAITISYKGIVERNTHKLFKTLKINEQLQFMIVTSILRGTWLNWNQFNKSTASAS